MPTHKQKHSNFTHPPLIQKTCLSLTTKEKEYYKKNERFMSLGAKLLKKYLQNGSSNQLSMIFPASCTFLPIHLAVFLIFIMTDKRIEQRDLFKQVGHFQRSLQYTYGIKIHDKILNFETRQVLEYTEKMRQNFFSSEQFHSTKVNRRPKIFPENLKMNFKYVSLQSLQSDLGKLF